MSYTLGERIPSDLYPLPAKDSLREFLHFIASVKARSHMTIGMTTGLQTRCDDRFAIRSSLCEQSNSLFSNRSSYRSQESNMFDDSCDPTDDRRDV